MLATDVCMVVDVRHVVKYAAALLK